MQSLRFRLLAVTLVAMLLALALSGALLGGLFRDHVMRQFEIALTAQLDQVTARLEFDASGRPRIDDRALSDPRWTRPYSGLYWQIDEWNAGTLDRGVLRSRSLWDAVLPVEADPLADGAVHVHRNTGPQGALLMLVERTVRREGSGDARWRLLVASDLGEANDAVARFDGVLVASLAVLLIMLGAAAVAQVVIGLAPLRGLQRALAAVREGRTAGLRGRFPTEVQPLVDEFNGVLDRNAEIVARARTQAGNLAHAIKTPLAAMAQAAAVIERHPERAGESARLVQEQVGVARRHVDWHLARSRAAAAHGLPGMRVAVAPVLAGLLRVMRQVHAERHLAIECGAMPPDATFAGEEQDLQEMLGNVLDNACKWARRRVQVSATAQGEHLQIDVDDDGPGIDPARRDAVLARGARIDESVPGAGLGLAIVLELVTLYRGTLALGESPLGGLRVGLRLPGGGGR